MSCLKEMGANEPAIFPLNLEIELGAYFIQGRSTTGAHAASQKTSRSATGTVIKCRSHKGT